MAITQPAHLKDSNSTKALKSRLGCKTCKIRRVKCGEEKPHCVRCTSTGRKCEYDMNVSCMANLEKSPLSIHPNKVWRERRAFAYYFQHVAASVGGGLDVDFWHSIVPQVCRSEPAVWDAMVSMSSLFESPDPCPDIQFPYLYRHRTFNQNQRDALDWYSRSVSAVRQGIQRGGVDPFVGLITCILFMCIEALLGTMDGAVLLYNQGVQLILALQAQIARGAVPAEKISLLENTIRPLFLRMGAVSFNTEVSVCILLQETATTFPQEFDTLKSAREAIVMLTAEIQGFEQSCERYLIKSQAHNISQEMMSEQIGLASKLKTWHTSFTRLMNSLCEREPLSPLQASSAAVLLAFYEMLLVIIGVCVSPSRITTDDYTQNFENIMNQANISLAATMRADGTQPPFTFELGAGLPIWFTVARCREPTIRRKALAMLRKGHEVQGLHRRDQSAIAVELIMKLEEAYGMALNAPQSPTDFMHLDFMSPSIEYQSYCLSMSNPSSSPLSSSSSSFSSSGNFKLDTTPNSSPNPPSPALESRKNFLPTPPVVLVPEGARIKPLGAFQPCNGLPPGTKEEDIAVWNRGNDQVFLYFSRNELDKCTNLWQTIYGYVPIDV